MSIITSESKGHILTFTNNKVKKHLYELDGVIVPGVTSINKKGFPTPERLLNWYKMQGKKSDKIATTAADLGKLLHKYAELRVKGTVWIDWEKEVEAESKEKLANCISIFEDWYKQNNTRTLDSELLVGSSTYKFAGTLDRLSLNTKDEIGIEDYKTSSGFFIEHFIQMAGYKLALYEWKGLDAKWFRINLFGKTKAEFHTLMVNKEGWFLDGVLYEKDEYAIQKLESQFLRNRKTYEFVDTYDGLLDSIYHVIKDK